MLRLGSAALARAEHERGHVEPVLPAAHARAMLALPREQQLAAAETVVQQRLSVRQTEQLVRRYLSGERKKKRVRVRQDADLRRLEEELSERLAAKVNVEHSGRRGRVVIEYNNLDELEGILERLRSSSSATKQ